jgi:hypothetical protein
MKFVTSASDREVNDLLRESAHRISERLEARPVKWHVGGENGRPQRDIDQWTGAMDREVQREVNLLGGGWDRWPYKHEAIVKVVCVRLKVARGKDNV